MILSRTTTLTAALTLLFCFLHPTLSWRWFVLVWSIYQSGACVVILLSFILGFWIIIIVLTSFPAFWNHLFFMVTIFGSAVFWWLFLGNSSATFDGGILVGGRGSGDGFMVVIFTLWVWRLLPILCTTLSISIYTSSLLHFWFDKKFKFIISN